MPAYYRRNTNKYGNIKRRIDGHTFDSIKEATRYAELKVLEKAGEISDLKLQVPYELQPAFEDTRGHKHRAIQYYADFVYTDKDGVTHIEDVKSEATRRDQIYRLKRKMMAYHGWYIEEV